MLNKTLILFVSLFTMLSLRAQTETSWTDLMDITFKDVYLESDDMYVYYPLFKEKQKSLDGEEISITGYIIPVDVELNQYVLSAFPFSACFFCGNAGPESVMAVYFSSPDQSFKTDERLTLQGNLELNDTNVDELVYVLRNATVKD
ncbi:MAG TPA: hypothetical protein VJ949_04350 [Cryomorphaceae bacterium]|nr:hypothetical protein [Cryomorphaceae bacterium]HKL40521.1 hypothetical protein [Cryomorphaceae bacterium]